VAAASGFGAAPGAAPPLAPLALLPAPPVGPVSGTLPNGFFGGAAASGLSGFLAPPWEGGDSTLLPPLPPPRLDVWPFLVSLAAAWPFRCESCDGPILAVGFRIFSTLSVRRGSGLSDLPPSSGTLAFLGAIMRHTSRARRSAPRVGVPGGSRLGAGSWRGPHGNKGVATQAKTERAAKSQNLRCCFAHEATSLVTRGVHINFLCSFQVAGVWVRAEPPPCPTVHTVDARANHRARMRCALLNSSPAGVLLTESPAAGKGGARGRRGRRPNRERGARLVPRHRAASRGLQEAVLASRLISKVASWSQNNKSCSRFSCHSPASTWARLSMLSLFVPLSP
jgi:hypothetical protein